MAREVKLGYSVEEIDIQNEEGKHLVTLKLNPEDDTFLAHFMDLYDSISALAEETGRKIAEMELKDKDLTTDTAKQIVEINIDAVARIIEETDKMFGDGFTREMFVEHYENNPNFSPNIRLFQEFYTKIMPIIQDIYKSSLNKYSVKKGK